MNGLVVSNEGLIVSNQGLIVSSEGRTVSSERSSSVLIFGFTVRENLLSMLMFVCDRCGARAAHRLVRRVRKFTLFFVPLFPVSTRYLDTCTHCGRVIEVPRDQAEAAVISAGRLG